MGFSAQYMLPRQKRFFVKVAMHLHVSKIHHQIESRAC